VFRSFVTLTAGEIIGRSLFVLGFLLFARAFGKDALGQFGLFITVTSYLVLVVQQGFDVIAIRAVSRDNAELQRYLRTVTSIRVVLASAAGLGCFAVAVFVPLQSSHKALLLVLSLRVFAAAVNPEWACRARERMRVVAFANVSSQAFFVGGVLFAQFQGEFIWAAVGQVAGEFIAAGIVLWKVIPEVLVSQTHRPVLPWRSLIRDAWPVTASLALGNVLYNFDVFAIAMFAGTAEVGIYLACYRCVSVFSPLLGAFSNSVYPSLTRMYPDAQRVRRITRRLQAMAFGVSASGALAIALAAPSVLTLLYGPEFVQASIVLRVLIWSLPIQACRVIPRQILIAFQRPKSDTLSMGAAVATNIGLDLLLAPLLGALGCAIATVVSEGVLLLAVMRFAKQSLNTQTSKGDLAFVQAVRRATT
jgi:O-antigen/teichoic acid export membrane protein